MKNLLSRILTPKNNTTVSNPKYRLMLDCMQKYIGSLQGKRILDAGSDNSGALLSEIMKNFLPTEIVGINPTFKETVKEITKGARLMKQSANDIKFNDNYFDHIVSLAAFEHFHDLPQALDELYRVLKPGGFLVSIFGPIWSSFNGHHLWTYVSGEEVSYRNTVLPPYCHLLMKKDELHGFCQNKYGDDLSRVIVEYVFCSPDQNKLFFSDYRKIFRKSPFTNIIFSGIVPFPESYGSTEYIDLFNTLHSRYPNKDGFEFGAIEVVLAKDRKWERS